MNKLPDWWKSDKPYIIQDCLEGMKSIPDKAVDLVLTDPPYGVGLDYGSTYNDSFDNWKILIDSFIPAAERITKGLILIPTSSFEGEKYLFTKHPPIWRICWYKGPAGTRSPLGFKDWETVFVYGNKPKDIQTQDYFFAQPCFVRAEIPNHPCPKPIKWATWLVEHLSKEGEIILDPFLGSGTTLLACRKTDRIGLGFEINPAYEEIIKKRSMEAIPMIESFEEPELIEPENLKPGVCAK